MKLTVMNRIALSAFLLFCLQLFPAVTLGQSNAINYVADLSEARNHYVTVEMTVVPTSDSTDLMMAVWTPGSYLVREYSRNVDTVTVQDTRGKDLEFEKTRKNRWTVKTRPGKKFTVKYRVFCRELSVRTSWIANNYAVLNGAATFMTVADQMENQHVIKLKLPEHWARSATSMKSSEQDSHLYIAENFDEVVDSPIVAGNVMVYPFEVGGIPHQLVNVGESGLWDGAKAALDLKKIVAEHHKMWGGIPYDRYLFINVIGGGGGGLEHDNSTLIMSSRSTFRERSRYQRWLSLASHEFFHTWNIRRLRPRALIKYDYENEVYTPSLWVGEGVTSYYQDLLLARAGFASKTQLLDSLSRNVVSTEGTVGRKKQSLRESSFDSWIKFYRPDENSSNTSISYYSKGAVVAFLLDAKLREATDGEKSLDDLMRTLYERHLKDGYLPSDLRTIANELAGEDLSEWFRVAVDSTEDLDYQPMMDWFGVEFSGQASALRRRSSEASSRNTRGTPWLGFRTSDSVVTSVTADSPATDVGINIDDEIIAVDGYRTRSIDSLLRSHKIGDELELLIARRNKMMTMNITLGARPTTPSRLRYVSRPNSKQRKRVDAWLGLPNESKEKVVEKKADQSPKLDGVSKADSVDSKEKSTTLPDKKEDKKEDKNDAKADKSNDKKELKIDTAANSKVDKKQEKSGR